MCSKEIDGSIHELLFCSLNSRSMFMLSITEFDEYLGEVMGIWVMGDG